MSEQNDDHLKRQAKDLEQMKFRVAQGQLPKREVEVYGKHQAEFWAKMGVTGGPEEGRKTAAQTWARKGVEGSQVDGPKQSQPQAKKPANDNKQQQKPGNDNARPAQAKQAQQSGAKQFARGGGGTRGGGAPPSRGR